MFAAGREDMQKMDHYTIETLGLPGAVLMENAGARVVEELLKLAAPHTTFVVFAGSGNNGGDGFVIARRLQDLGHTCTLFLATDPSHVKGDARIHFDVYTNRQLPILYAKDATPETIRTLVNNSSIIVDALLGTGARGEIREPIRSIITLINEAEKITVAVDIPSGVNSDTGAVDDIAVCAHQTITFVAPKQGFFLQQGSQHIGQWQAVDISVPPSIAHELSLELPHVITAELAKASVPKRPRHGHKGTFGHVLVIGGSKPYVGAPIFSAKAALHAGAGLVTLGIPETVYPMAATQLPTALFWPMEEVDGHLAVQTYTKKQLETYDVCAVGPGLSRFAGGELWMQHLLDSLSGQPLVLDADGLYIARNLLDLLRTYKGPVVLTPHPGEMAMLLQTTVTQVEANRLEIAKQFATEHRVYLLLKGHRSILATPDGTLYINPIGGDALGKGGSGDVLTGILASFLAQGAEPLEAMIAATYLHAEAAELQADIQSHYGVTAPDIIEGCQRVLRQWSE
ncbi:NAD(P)H-hydrate dehydratase [Sporosarcina sp. PTS2304]|uniref:NAD(P)H-hydrate dehydratase n=1 Tax=Sporosarcina sp. PTS2304 TaxID=2283194 RepID=UPI000E0D1C09|nr:NAD(P)H-hydrate dehydratase [Sporosarcina sp. PTS2304]AXH99787.1 NAD(P)H-hydrate dehydratase [Sporosarcina sp. PTS2304]